MSFRILFRAMALMVLLSGPWATPSQAQRQDVKKRTASGKDKSPAASNAAKSNVAKSEGATEGNAPKVTVERGRGGKKVYRITQGFVIEGRIQKPNAFYVLQRSQINYDWAGLKQNFVPRILDAVRKSPF